MGICQPQVLQGRWESRIVSESEGTESRGQHITQRAITLDLPDPEMPTHLQALVGFWHQGETYLQACAHLPRAMILRISRFRAGPNGETIKLHTRVAIPHHINMPAFTHRELGGDCSHHRYAVVACVLHCGTSAGAGHYTARFINHLTHSEAPEAPPQWKADDSRPTQSVRLTPPNDTVLGQQCYLVMLCRCGQ